MNFPWRPLSAGAVAPHVARVVGILARMSFWVLCFHYYGTHAVLYVAAAWGFTLGARDLTYARIRLTSVDDPDKRVAATFKSLAAEALLLVLRVAVMVALGFVLQPFNATVATFVWWLSICAIFWSRETSRALMRAFNVSGLGLYVSSLAPVAGLGAILLLAESGQTATVAAIGSLILREAFAFLGMLLSALAGRLGLRVAGVELDEEGGAQQYSVVGAGGREVRSPWKVLIAENVVWSRWRLVQFVTRFAAGGVLGPIGSVGSRLFFSYRQPGAYVHRDRISARKVILFAGMGMVSLLAVTLVAQRYGLLEAVGITVAGFMFRLISQGANVLMWRQLTPLVAVGAKVRLPRRR